MTNSSPPPPYGATTISCYQGFKLRPHQNITDADRSATASDCNCGMNVNQMQRRNATMFFRNATPQCNSKLCHKSRKKNKKKESQNQVQNMERKKKQEIRILPIIEIFVLNN
jgi:hypothetical protein